MIYKQKTVTPSPELLQKFYKAIGRHTGRCTESDVDKELEMGLCDLFFQNAGIRSTVEPAPEDLDIKHDVDCIVNGYKVQVKCRRDGNLYIEDFKTRNNRKYPGWLDRSAAEIFLFVYPVAENVLGARIYMNNVLKDLLACMRKDPTKTEVRTPYGLVNFVYHPERLYNEKDGYGAYFEVFV